MSLLPSSFQKEMEDILIEIDKLSKNMFVEKYVPTPQVAMIRIQLLNLFLQYASVPLSKRKSYCVTAGLVQLGLDLHETISNQKKYHEREIRKRQLSILAGDYYSSQYYHLLAQHNLIDGVKKLAEAIRDINIAKMKLYTSNNGQGFKNLQHVVNTIKDRESGLYIQFMDHLEPEEQLLWKEMIKEMILLSTLADEANSYHIYEANISYSLIHFFATADESKEIVDLHLSETQTRMKHLYLKYNIEEKKKKIMSDIYQSVEQKFNSLQDRGIKGELQDILNGIAISNNLTPAIEKI